MASGTGAAKAAASYRRQTTGLEARQEWATGPSQRLMAEINAFGAGKEATKSAYTAAEEVAKTMARR